MEKVTGIDGRRWWGSAYEVTGAVGVAFACASGGKFSAKV